MERALEEGAKVMCEMIRTVSMSATRQHPWEGWIEPVRVSRYSAIAVDDEGMAFLDTRKFAMYMGVRVEIVKELNLCALVRRGDGLSCIVDRADLEVSN